MGHNPLTTLPAMGVMDGGMSYDLRTLRSGLVTVLVWPFVIASVLRGGLDDIDPMRVMVFAAFPATTFAATTAAIWWTL